MTVREPTRLGALHIRNDEIEREIARISRHYRHKQLSETEEGYWAVSQSNPRTPFGASRNEFEVLEAQ